MEDHVLKGFMSLSSWLTAQGESAEIGLLSSLLVFPFHSFLSNKLFPLVIFRARHTHRAALMMHSTSAFKNWVFADFSSMRLRLLF